MSGLLLGIFATLIVLLSAWGVLAPDRLVRFVRRFMEGPGVWGAALVRVVLAVLLWFAAPASRTPLVFMILAALALAAAVALPMIGDARVMRLIDRFAAWPAPLVSALCTLGLAFGGYLLWAVWP